jgi:hypothetical protein
MTAGRPAAAPIQSVLVVQTERSDIGVPEKGVIECRLFDAQGQELGSSRADVSLERGRRARSAFNINVLPITNEGVYRYRVFHVIDGESRQVDELPLRVMFDAPNAPA